MATNPPKTKMRNRVKHRDGRECRYCGKTNLTENRLLEATHRFLTIDHIVPLCQGGTNGIDNLVVSCRSCNRLKGERTLEELGWALLPPRASQIPKVHLERIGWTPDTIKKQRKNINSRIMPTGVQ